MARGWMTDAELAQERVYLQLVLGEVLATRLKQRERQSSKKLIPFSTGVQKGVERGKKGLRDEA